MILAGALVFLVVACHGDVERVPLASDVRTFRDRFLDVHTPDGNRVVVVGGGGKILVSRDGGAGFEPVPSGTDKTILRVAFADETHGWAVGQDGLILRTTDAGQSWSAQSSGTKNHLFGVVAVSRDRAYACGDRSQWVATSDGGATWTASEIPLSDVGLDPEIALAVEEPIYYDVALTADRSTAYVVGDYGNIRATRDGGKTWEARHEELLGQTMPGELRPVRDALDLPALFRIRVAADGRTRIVGVGGLLIESDEDGRGWRVEPAGIAPDVRVPLFELAEGTAGPIVFGGSGVALRLDEGGWRRVPLGLPLLTWVVAASFAPNGEDGFAVGGRGLILRTTDGGRTWHPLGTDFPGTA